MKNYIYYLSSKKSYKMNIKQSLTSNYRLIKMKLRMHKIKQVKNTKEHREYKKIARIIDKAYKETVESIKKYSECPSSYKVGGYQFQ